MRPLLERKSAPVGDRGASKIDNVGTSNDKQEYNPDNEFHQGKFSYAPSPYPVAVARQFGFCHAVFVRHLSGQEERRGLFESAINASIAAWELNRLFAQEMESALSAAAKRVSPRRKNCSR